MHAPVHAIISSARCSSVGRNGDTNPAPQSCEIILRTRRGATAYSSAFPCTFTVKRALPCMAHVPACAHARMCVHADTHRLPGPRPPGPPPPCPGQPEFVGVANFTNAGRLVGVAARRTCPWSEGAPKGCRGSPPRSCGFSSSRSPRSCLRFPRARSRRSREPGRRAWCERVGNDGQTRHACGYEGAGRAYRAR